MATLVSDERLGRAMREPRPLAGFQVHDPVAAVVVEELAAAAGPCAAALRAVGATFLDVIGAGEPRGPTLGLRTAIAVLAATERTSGDVAAELQRLTDGDPLLRMTVAALVRHRPGGEGLRPAGEARAVAELLCKLISMFRAESEGAALAAVVA